ncbi:MAG: TRAP transporter small permease subunit [Polyangiaceae bacterium]|nr:TRAP transporter small permease subunit [Polyangiaceae bacterium]
MAKKKAGGRKHRHGSGAGPRVAAPATGAERDAVAGASEASSPKGEGPATGAGTDPGDRDDQGPEDRDEGDAPAAERDGGDAPGDTTGAGEGDDREEGVGSEGAEPPAADEAAAARSTGQNQAPAHWLLRFDHAWTWLEARLLFAVLAALILVLCFWISLNGMKDPVEGPSKAGMVFRAVFGAAVLGLGTRFAVRKSKLSDRGRAVVIGVAVVAGLALAPVWRRLGVSYASNFYAWFDSGSSLALFGGLHGVSTRLTVLLALLGGSLAAGSGSHINIDLVVRFLPLKWRRFVHVLGSLATAAVCLVASWAFFNYVAIESYHARLEMTAAERIGHVVKRVGDQMFLWRKQIGFDFGALGNVLQGKDWDDDGARTEEITALRERIAGETEEARKQSLRDELADVVAHPREPRMNGRQWNEWLEGAGFAERFGPESLATMRAPDDALDKARTPFVVLPEGGNAMGLLVPTMNLLFPFGLFMIALRLLLRALLVTLGLKSAEPEGSEESAESASEPKEAAR